MTVLIREELNDADLAWAAGDPGVAATLGQILKGGPSTVADHWSAACDGDSVDPSVLRARGAL